MTGFQTCVSLLSGNGALPDLGGDVVEAKGDCGDVGDLVIVVDNAQRVGHLGVVCIDKALVTNAR